MSETNYTPDEICAVLNEHKWRGRDNWYWDDDDRRFVSDVIDQTQAYQKFGCDPEPPREEQSE